jgi:hypothetical protein
MFLSSSSNKLISVSLFIVLIIAGIVFSGFLNYQTGKDKGAFLSSLGPTGPRNLTAIYTNVTIIGVDITKQVMNVRFDHEARGDLANPNRTPAQALSVVIQSVRFDFQAGVPMQGRTIDVFIRTQTVLNLN